VCTAIKSVHYWVKAVISTCFKCRLEPTKNRDMKKVNDYLLFTPGPVNVADNVRIAITKKDICHREIDFDALLKRTELKLLSLFEIRNKPEYRAVVITGSGTAANESILSSVVGDKNILIISNGEFGERLFNLSKIYNRNTSLLDFAWGERLDFKKIGNHLSSNCIDIVMMVHHETSSGMLNSLEDMGKLSKAYGILFIADCVSSAGAEKIDMEKYHIGFCSSSSSKAICSYPGLSFVVGRVEEFEKLKYLPIKSGYLNLYKLYHFIKMVSQTPHTPAVPLFYALEQALDNILDKGIAHHHTEIQDKAEFLRNGMAILGLKFMLDKQNMSSVLTTVYCPFYLTIPNLRKALHEKMIIIYEGKGCFKNKVFQVGNIGKLSFNDLQFFLNTVKVILQKHKQTRRKTKPLINAYPRLLDAIKAPINHKSLPVVVA